MSKSRGSVFVQSWRGKSGSWAVSRQTLRSRTSSCGVSTFSYRSRRRKAEGNCRLLLISSACCSSTLPRIKWPDSGKSTSSCLYLKYQLKYVIVQIVSIATVWEKYRFLLPWWIWRKSMGASNDVRLNTTCRTGPCNALRFFGQFASSRSKHLNGFEIFVVKFLYTFVNVNCYILSMSALLRFN